jgi:NitT/TauT family transport system ATP-binding protein
MRILLEAINLSKTYHTIRGDKVQAVSPLNFQISECEFISILGPSGCGKTTILMMLAGLESISGGQLLLDGKPITGPNRQVGLVFQKPVLLPWRTVLENAMLPIEVMGRDSKEYKERALRQLEMVGLKGFENKYPTELSGGMQQRNSIIRALIHDPSILLMDEPFGALDAMTRENMNLELQRIFLESRKTIVLITHSIPEALFLSDRVFVMSARPGKIVEEIIVPFPRPRTFDILEDPEFNKLANRARGLFGVSNKAL